MLGDSTVLRPGSSAPAAAAGAATGGSHEGGVESSAAAAAAAGGGGGGGGGSNSGDDDRSGRGEEFGDRSSVGNRWPRQETLALLKIRSDMDVAFRDGSVKRPLWEEVSRKLAELGYSRSGKKCKEKFENVYKYHKRTKEGRTGKADGKTYRFFDQLQALESNPSMHSISVPSKPETPPTAVTMEMAAPPQQTDTPSLITAAQYATVPSTSVTPKPIYGSQDITNSSINLTFSSHPPTEANPTTSLPPSRVNPTTVVPASSFQSTPTDLVYNSTSSSSSTSSDEKVQGRRNKRKRKWKRLFEKLMKEVIDKQEDMRKRFLEALEKREHKRMVREDAWRAQEMERINREREILAQERSMAYAKDAAVMSFLKKIAEQQNLGQAFSNINFPAAQPQQASILSPVNQPAAPVPPRPQSQLQHQTLPLPPKLPSSVPQHQVTTSTPRNIEFANKEDNCEQNFLPASSSRWPKVEVQALIQLRTSLDTKYQDSGPKGPLWEEISAAMRKLGYSRNAKRCKEKWENINKYYKKVKESNKKRPEDSKTCPYFHLLDAIYKEKNKFDNSSSSGGKPESFLGGGAPLMVRPEQQWPPKQELRQGRTGQTGPGPDTTMEDLESEPQEEHYHEDNEEDEGGSNFETGTSKSSSAGDQGHVSEKSQNPREIN